MVDGQHRDRQFGLAAQQLVRHVRQQGGVVLHAHIRVAFQVAGHHGRQKVQRQAGAGTQGKRAFRPRRQVAGEFVDAQCFFKQRPHFLEQAMGFLRGRELALVAIEQLQAQALFGVCDQPADGRLRHEQQLGRSVHGSRQHHGPEHFHLSQLEPHGLNPIINCYNPGPT
ncbi:hypothetical protein D3C85_1073510 [compost metagenome]